MPCLVGPVIDPERLAGVAQPSIRSLTAGLVLRPWRADDVPQLLDAFADEHIQRWHLWSLDSAAEATDWIARWRHRWLRHTGASWAVTTAESGELVLGQVGFRSLHLSDGLAELSLWTTPAYRRRRLGSGATRALADWALDHLGLQRLEIVHSLMNPVPCVTARNAGFTVEGTKRSLQRHRDGFHDMHLHSRIRGLSAPTSDSGEWCVRQRVGSGRADRIPCTTGSDARERPVCLTEESR